MGAAANMLTRAERQRATNEARRAVEDRAQFDRLSPVPPPSPTQRLLESGFRPLPKETKGGVFLSVTRYGIGLSVGLLAAIGRPRKAHVLIRPADGAIAVVAAAADDTTAYSVKDRGRAIHSDRLAEKLRGKGWEPGRYGVRVDAGAVICEREPLP